MATKFVPIYPAENGIFTHKFMPNDLDWSKPETKHWRWEPKAYAALEKMSPEEPYKQVYYFSTLFLNSGHSNLRSFSFFFHFFSHRTFCAA
jgi:hypothetical protein